LLVAIVIAILILVGLAALVRRTAKRASDDAAAREQRRVELDAKIDG